jgi:hypothetical protein
MYLYYTNNRIISTLIDSPKQYTLRLTNTVKHNKIERRNLVRNLSNNKSLTMNCTNNLS